MAYMDGFVSQLDHKVLITSYHEAGHVVAAVKAGRQVTMTHVSFRKKGTGATYHSSPPKNSYYPGNGPGAARAAWEHTLHSTRREMRILLAGPLAEAKYLGKPLRADGSHNDLNRCILLADRLAVFNRYMSTYTKLPMLDVSQELDSARDNVQQWLGRRKTWSMIEYIADQLMRNGSLIHSDIHFMLGKVISGERQNELGQPDMSSVHEMLYNFANKKILRVESQPGR